VSKIYATKKERIAELEVNVSKLKQEVEHLKFIVAQKQDKQIGHSQNEQIRRNA
jgi:uncharacterized coiled-coil protein SlyX